MSQQIDLTPQQQQVLNSVKQAGEKNMSETNLDMDLQAIEDMIEEQAPAEEPLQEAVPLQEEMRQEITNLLADREDAPSADQILAWKEAHGQDAIQLLGLDKSNVYIYTHLTVAQWDKIQGIIQKVQGTPMADNIERMIRDNVVRTAVLWPELPKALGSMRAGLPDTLYQLILIHSYFLSPQQAMTLTVSL